MQRVSLVLLILISTSLQGEILDRMRAVVNNHIITSSDMKRERNIRLALGEKELKDDKDLLQDMIDAWIIDEQVAEFPEIDVPDAAVQDRMDHVSTAQGLAFTTMRSAVQRRLRMSEFFDLRFRQFLTASDEEVRKYYDTVFVPEAHKRGLSSIPTIDAVSPQIRSNIIDAKMTPEIDDWLAALRKRSNVEVFE